MRGISRESERMSLLVDDLLLLARLDDGRPLERDAVALDEVVGEAVETAQAVEPDRPIALAAEHLVVLGDRDRLRQIVDNLLANVRAHTPAGTAVSVSLRPENGDAVLEVADRGRGSRRRSSSTSSSASTGPTRRAPARAAAPASGSRSSPRSPRRTGDGWRRGLRRMAARCSRSSSRWRRARAHRETHGVSPATPATLGAETETEEVA